MSNTTYTLKSINIDASKQVLKQCLQKSNLSQNYISMAMGVSPQAVSSWFNLYSKKMPTMENMINLSIMLGIDYLDALVLDDVKVEITKLQSKYDY